VRAPSRFSHEFPVLQQLVQDAIGYAGKRGASACEVEVSEGFGQSVTARKGAVETIEYNRDKGLGVTVYLGQRKGHASTSDLSAQACRDTIDAALAIARFTAPDDCAGLPDPAMLAKDVRDLDLYHPWAAGVEEAIELARRCEAAAFAVSPEITNSEGATVSMQEGHFCMGNSLGFLGGYKSSRHYIACSVIAGEGDAMQRDDWYSTARDPARIADPAAIGDYAARRALARRNGRRVKTGSVPVIFEAPLAASLLGNFVHAASGGSLYRKASFLTDALGKPLFPKHISISEDPFELAGLASSPFDNDGVRTQAREVVSRGVLKGYFLSTYTARKLGLASTGNAGGCHNLKIASTQGAESLDAMIRRMGRGLLVTELLGHGVNYVTGDYSRGASGYWVENGAIAWPVEEITIAGNLREMLGGIVAIGDDVVVRGSKQCGSILVDKMTVAGG
jgi:PmbA protein